MADVKNTSALFFRALISFIIYGIIFFIVFGVGFVTSGKSLYYIPLAIFGFILVLIAQTALNKSKDFRAIGYFQDDVITPNFIKKSKYWNKPYRVLLATLALTLIVIYLGTIFQGAVLGEIASSTPTILEAEGGNWFLEAVTHVEPATFAELMVIILLVMLTFGVVSKILRSFGASQSVKWFIGMVVSVIVVGFIAVLWHSNVYQSNTEALIYIGFFFGFQVFTMFLTGSAFVADILHIVNNFALGLYLTTQGTNFLKIAVPVALILIFAIWTIDRMRFRKKKSKLSKNSFIRTFQKIGRFLFPTP